MVKSADRRSGISQDTLRVRLRWAGLVLVVLGLWQLAEGMTSREPTTVARLFFPAERVDLLVQEALTLSAPYVEVCRDGQLKGGFDSISLRRLERWCRAVERFGASPGPATAAGLLRSGNLHFDRIVEKMVGSAGAVAHKGVALYEARCALRPVLEQVNSQLAGAAFSQGLLGAILATVGGWFLFRRKNNSGVAAAV
jgi:hypothetical protein